MPAVFILGVAERLSNIVKKQRHIDCGISPMIACYRVCDVLIDRVLVEAIVLRKPNARRELRYDESKDIAERKQHIENSFALQHLAKLRTNPLCSDVL